MYSKQHVKAALMRIRLSSIAISLILPVIAFGLQFIFWSQIKPYTWYLFYPAVFLSSALGGWRAGITSLSVSVLLGSFYYDTGSLIPLDMNSDQISSLALFLIMGIAFSIFNGHLSSMIANCGHSILSLIHINENMRRINDELKETTAALHRNEERLKLAISGADVGVWEWDLQSDIVHCSDSFKRQLGFDGEEFPTTATEMRNFLDPESSQSFTSEFEKFLTSNGTHYQSEVRLRHRDNGYRWFMIRGCLQRNMQGNPVKMSGIRLDITQQKNAEERFCGLLESTPDPILVCNNNGEFVFVNKQFESQFGYTREEVIGQSIEIVMPERFRSRHRHLRMMYFEKPYPRFMGQGRELVGRRKDGSEFPIEVSLGPFRTNDGYLVTAAIRDTTERTKIEKELCEAKEIADRANTAKSFFLANMSHEIRTPLSVMIGYSELISANTNSAEIISYARVVQQNGEILLNLINDILDLSKVEAGKIEVKPKWIDLDKFLLDILKGLRIRADKKGIIVNLSYDGSIPEAVFIDESRFRQILANVIGNAIKFTDRGEVNVVVSLNETAAKPILEVNVHDSGPGISAESFQRIFEPFTQESTSICHSFGGTGLGLNLSRKLARALGGDLYLKASIVGQGSTFTATVDPGDLQGVPRISERHLHRHLEAAKTIDQSRLRHALRDVRVLLVEDAEDIQTLMLKFLEVSGAVTDVAPNGKEAIEKISSMNFDIVLMDIQMPVMNGYDAITYLRAASYRGPVIALTANAMKNEIDRCIECGFTAYLSKPVSHRDLVETILRHIPTAPPRRQNQQANVDFG